MKGYTQPPALPIVLSEWDIDGVGIGEVREVRQMALDGDWRISAVIVHGGPRRVVEYSLSWWNENAVCRWLPS